jgi:hypothetical protein
MQFYGIRLADHDIYDDITGCEALDDAREAIEARIGKEQIIGTRASHSLEETYFLVRDRCLAEEAIDAIREKGIPAEYIPLTIREGAERHRAARFIPPNSVDIFHPAFFPKGEEPVKEETVSTYGIAGTGSF